MSKILAHRGYIVLVLLLIAAGTSILCFLPAVGVQSVTEVTIDTEGPVSPWGKSVGDINGDGRPDLIVGGHSKSQPSVLTRILNKYGLWERNAANPHLVWYENPRWQKHIISTDFRVRTDLAVGDIDEDGLNDIVVLADRGVFWLKNPTWNAYEIVVSESPPKFHDVELADLDRDGDLDVVLRSQSMFGYENGNKIFILAQAENGWQETVLNVDHGEGLKVGDLNRDDFDDIAVNNVWLKNPGIIDAAHTWESVDYTSDWVWRDVYIDIHDVNSDERPDIVLSPAEPVGRSYRISWFEAPADEESTWIEHVIEDNIETVHHFVGAGDFNGDGYADIFSAEMNQGEDPDEVKVYLNSGDHVSWEKLVLSKSGAHSMQVADFDDDGDAEVAGANWQISDYTGNYAVSLWDYTRESTEGWARHKIGDNAPWRNLFVYVADVNGDNMIDIVTGRSWFENRGEIGSEWNRHEIVTGLNTALYVHDFDRDGDIDVFGSAGGKLLSKPSYLQRAKAKLTGTPYPGTGSGNGGQFHWARNDGHGKFQLYDNIEPVAGDYLQGISKHVDASGEGLLLSWHTTSNGIQRVNIPADPTVQTWSARTISDYSQDEQLSTFDVNGDGTEDVVTGTSWLDPKANWEVNQFFDTEELPDRHAVCDIDGNGTIDVIVGYEATSEKGKLGWYSGIAVNTLGESREHVLDYPVGPMSLSTADMDADGDIDVVVGEHNLENPKRARLLFYENTDGDGKKWRRSQVARGDEHHNGALVIDLDKDGDKDIVSIGWGHSNVLVYENQLIR